MKAKKIETLTQERLKLLVSYDEYSGILTWKVNHRGTKGKWSEAGYIQPIGYRRLRLDRRDYLSHRLAWLYCNGVFPPGQIDHINGIKDDNRIINLRLATNQQNQRNTEKYSNNTSGFKGVTYSKRDRKWQAQAKLNGKQIHLGCFASAKYASAAYQKFAEAKHGNFYYKK